VYSICVTYDWQCLIEDEQVLVENKSGRIIIIKTGSHFQLELKAASRFLKGIF